MQLDWLQLRLPGLDAGIIEIGAECSVPDCACSVERLAQVAI